MLFFYYTISSVLSIIILRWLGALAPPGKLRAQGARRSVAAQLPLSRATCPTAPGAEYPARGFLGQGAAFLSLLPDSQRSKARPDHRAAGPRKMHSAPTCHI